MNGSLANRNQSASGNVDSSTAWYNQGDRLANLGKYEEALACFEKALELRPDDPEGLVFRAVMLIHLKRYNEALESCERVLDIQPKHSEAWLFRGVALYHLSRYEEAYRSYEQALGTHRHSLRQVVVQTVTKFRRLFGQLQPHNRLF